MHDEINELRKRLDKLAAKSSEATPSTTSSPFSLEIQQAPLPASFHMSTMTTYERKINPQDHLDSFNDMLCSHADGNNEEMVLTDRTRNCHLLDTTLGIVHAPVPRSKKVSDPFKSFGQYQTRVE